MAQVKNQMMLEQEQEFELALSYQEYLQEDHNEPTGLEIMEMAKEMLSPSTFSQLFWYVFATNNTEYRPTVGA